MRKIARLQIKLRKPDNTGFFHDTRGDVRKLAEAINILIDKQNEVVNAVNQLIEDRRNPNE
ncbi:hypothetical protein [Paenibacillus pinihumi]|uniref:hypothetical protein n=1 Tax=Paenibacillus pinihumi TaxID=669462 RepID=UPI000491B7A1|nr:hypothetical protein [Paenibacillus pinihumi]